VGVVLKEFLIGTLAVALSASAGRLTAQTPPSGAAPPPGVLVDIGGHRLHIRCVGPAGAKPTVILEAGGGAFSSAWSQVQDLLSGDVRSCAYDRAGSGWSDAGPAPRTMRQEIFELHALLEAASVRGPFVLVGHSIGGLLVRVYADQFGSDVVGVVLVDPTHESAVLYSVPLGRWVRLREQAKDRVVPEPRREGRASAQYNPDEDYLAEEFQLLYLSRQANPVPLGNRPLVVLAAGKRPAPPGTSDSLWQVLRRERDEQVRDLARLSRNSKFVLDTSSGHGIPQDNPRLVARSIREALEAASRGTRLVP
jgi:pimeloyl-ACP methyl ester carboxylesterase